jgi:hypothetical protein
MFSNFFKRFSLIVSTLVLVVFISCKDEKSNKSTSESNDSPAQTITTPGANTSNSADVAINPPHGQPGHRCDIKVGDPLPSGSSTSNSPVINTTQKSPVINNTGSVPVNNNTSTANLNPPHGQPGHRCEIPVGAPLN